MFKKMTMRTRLLIPTFTLIAVLVFLGYLVISSRYATMQSLRELEKEIRLSTRLSDIIHSLQRERGLTSGLLMGSGGFGKDLRNQRETGDRLLEALDRELGQGHGVLSQPLLDELRRKFGELRTTRERVDRKRISAQEATGFYTRLNETLLAIVLEIAKRSHVPEVTQNLLAYLNFLHMKEFGGLERAQGVMLLSSPLFDVDAYARFTDLIACQKEKEKMFLAYAPSEIGTIYADTLGKKAIRSFGRMEKRLLDRSYLHDPIPPRTWYDTSTRRLDLLDGVGKRIEASIGRKIGERLRESRRFFYLMMFLTFVSLLLFLAMVRTFLKLAAEEQRLRFVMDKYVISSVTDLKGRIVDVSQAFCEISGYSRAELLGKNHNIVRHPDMPSALFRELWEKLKRGESWSGKVKNRKKDGGFYWVYAHIEPLYNAKGEKDAYISVRLDITETELLTEQIQEEARKNRLHQEMMQQQHRLAQMGEMLSMIAHQWRQPLSAITAATAALELKAKMGRLDEDTALHIAEKIKSVAQHLSATIDDFRNFYKSNREKHRTDFKKITDSVTTLVENSLKKHGITLDVTVERLAELETYENELKQVLLNLLKNAEEALVEKGTADPRIDVTIDGHRLVVSDNGGGIAPEVMERIFDPYFSTKTQKDGTGLGLYMSKMIVEEHCGGRLSVSNLAQGARFTIELESDDERTTTR